MANPILVESGAAKKISAMPVVNFAVTGNEKIPLVSSGDWQIPLQNLFFQGLSNFMQLRGANYGDIISVSGGIQATIAGLPALLNVAFSGDVGTMLFVGADGQWQALPAGTEGQTLKMVSGVPTWV